MSEAEKETAEGFLSRWSRRKREVVEAPQAPPADSLAVEPVPSASPEEEAGLAAAERPAAERGTCPIPEIPDVDPASLPPVESLTVDSDFSAFLKPGVPTLLRNAALRRMWSLDPAIRDYIGPVDYQWDFNTPGGLPFGFANELTGDVSKLLAQAIGKLEELAEEKPGEVRPETAEAGPTDMPPAGADSEQPREDEPPPVLVADAVPAVALSVAPEPTRAPRRRHGSALPG